MSQISLAQAVLKIKQLSVNNKTGEWNENRVLKHINLDIE